MDQLVLTPGIRRQATLDLLASARRRVALSLFRCDDSRVLDEIIATARRGIVVSVLITPRAKGWNKRLGGLVTLLSGTGVQVKQYDGPFSKYHAKYIIVDGEIVMIGSANLTRKCFDNTCDFLLLSRDPELVRDLMLLFESDWNTPQQRLELACRRLIIGPDHMRYRMLEYLESARYRIRIIDHRVSHPEVLVTLQRKMADGLHVEILGRGQLSGLASHGKMLLVDDHLAVIGSASLSRPGLDIRREVSVTIEDPAALAVLKSSFSEMAAQSAQPESADAESVDDEEEDAD
jgi:cardiolipin synthase